MVLNTPSTSANNARLRRIGLLGPALSCGPWAPFKLTMVVAVVILHWMTEPLVTCLAPAAHHRGHTFEVAKGGWDVAFTALVCAVTDNTIHALCLWAALLALAPTPL